MLAGLHTCIFLQDLPDFVERKHIVQYLEQVSKCKVNDVWFALQQGKALVLFRNMPGEEHMGTPSGDAFCQNLCMYMYSYVYRIYDFVMLEIFCLSKARASRG